MSHTETVAHGSGVRWAGKGVFTTEGRRNRGKRSNHGTHGSHGTGGGGVAGGYEGRYFIMDANGGRRAPVLGYANVARDGDTYHLVAQFGEVEVRAELMVMGGNVVAREAGARARDTFIPAYGYGNAQPDGTLLCSGQTGTSNRFYQVVAHRVP